MGKIRIIKISFLFFLLFLCPVYAQEEMTGGQFSAAEEGFESAETEEELLKYSADSEDYASDEEYAADEDYAKNSEYADYSADDETKADPDEYTEEDFSDKPDPDDDEGSFDDQKIDPDDIEDVPPKKTIYDIEESESAAESEETYTESEEYLNEELKKYPDEEVKTAPYKTKKEQKTEETKKTLDEKAKTEPDKTKKEQKLEEPKKEPEKKEKTVPDESKKVQEEPKEEEPEKAEGTFTSLGATLGLLSPPADYYGLYTTLDVKYRNYFRPPFYWLCGGIFGVAIPNGDFRILTSRAEKELALQFLIIPTLTAEWDMFTNSRRLTCQCLRNSMQDWL